MQRRIALEELNKNLAAAKGNVDAWASVKIRKADDLKATQKSTVEEDRAQLRTLEAERDEIARQTEAARERLRTEEEEEQEVRLELEEREREARRAEEQLNSWQQTLGKQQLDVEGSEKDVALELNTAEAKLAAVESEVQKFQKWLGLSFVRSEDVQGELLLVFTHIDPKAHDAEFVIGVQVVAGGKYEVTACRPPLPGIDELVVELNNSGQFGDFVKSARKLLKQTV